MQRFGIDVHILDATDDAVVALRDLQAAKRIRLVRTDAMRTELDRRQDAGHRQELLAESEKLEELAGVMVLGFSRLGHTRLGSDRDAASFEELWEILWPDYDRFGPETGNMRTRTFDTMHIHTCAINDFVAFVTRDQRLLRCSAAVEKRFGLRILTPEQAVTLVEAEE